MSKPNGPYFKGQTQQRCGCYYPDVSVVRDEDDDNPILYCVRHGFFSEPEGDKSSYVLPKEKWLEEERAKVRKTK